jgi:alanine-glyoxylate transaminase / serine-glyoxylate transaminase / serine-pyruvate transaminase
MPAHLKLFTPGPGDVDEDVLSALATPVLRHYGPEWMEIYTELLARLRPLFNTQADLFVVPGAASALLDMALGSLVLNGDKVIIGSNGFFGDRLVDIARSYGATVVPFTAPLGQPLDPAELGRLLRENPEAQVVALVHHETATTVLNPLPELAAVTRAAGRILVVDTVSSLGGMEVRTDDWGLDVCVTGPNKCMEAVPGIGFVSVSARAWEFMDRRPDPGHGWYLNLRTWRKYATEWGTWHPTPVTLPVNNVLAVLTSLRRIQREGIDTHFAKYIRASQSVRRELTALGFKMFVPEAFASPVVTAVCARPEFEVAEMSQWLARERGLAIGGGLGALSGKIFRVGHLGPAAGEAYRAEFLAAMKDFLQTKGLAQG